MKILLVPALLFVPFVVPAQIYSQGYVVFNSGDTLSGVLELKEEVYNPVSVNYKKNSESTEVKKYSIRDVTSIVFQGWYAFDRHYVSLTLDATNLEEANKKRAQVKFDTVFLKVLQRGAVNFYSFEDKIKKRYYIRQSNADNALELGFRVEKEGPNFTYHTPYKETLKLIAEGQNKLTPKLSLRINRSKYTEASLLPIISDINGVEMPKRDRENIQGKGFRFGAGIDLSKIYLYRENYYSVKATATSSPGFWALAAYDFPINPSVGKVVFRGELLFSTTEFAIHTYEDRFTSDVTIDHTVSQKICSPGGTVVYNFVNKPNVKAFASLGVRFNYSFNSFTFDEYRTSSSGTTVLSTDVGEPRRMWSSFPLKAGIVLKKKFELGLLYIPKRPIHGYDSYYMYAISLMEAGLVYHLKS